MAKNELVEILRPIVRQYGVERVELAMGKLRKAGEERVQSSKFAGSASCDNPNRRSNPGKRPRLTAPLYIAKLDLAPEICQLLTQLADKFENKQFLPTIGEVRNFCLVHGIEEPSSSSRVGAIPRVFRFLTTLPASDIRTILRSDMFSGPAQLGPIADAIRRNSSRRMGTDPDAGRTVEPIPKDLGSAASEP